MSISISTVSPVNFGEPRQSATSVATAVSQQQGSVAVSASAVQAASNSTDISNQLSENPNSSVSSTKSAGGAESSAGATNTANGAASETDGQQLEEAVSTIKEFVQSINRDLNFSMDDSTGQVVVKITDGTSGDVIRQIPSEEALHLAKRLQEVRSLLFEAKA